jgi:hypothetical protein
VPVSGPTPVADFIENAWAGLMMAVFGPIMAIVVVAIPAAVIVFWIAQPTGLLAVWGAMVVSATGPAQPAASFAARLGQDLIFRALLALLLTLPGLRKAPRTRRPSTSPISFACGVKAFSQIATSLLH